MTLVSRRRFERALRELNTEEFAALLADLYAARGWTTEVHNEVVIATPDDTGSVSLRIRPLPGHRFNRLKGDTTVLDSIALVVTARDSERIRQRVAQTDTTYHSPADLYDQLLYAVDRETGERLLREHLGLAVRVTDDGIRSTRPREIIRRVRSRIGTLGRPTVLIGLLLISTGVVIGLSLPLLPDTPDQRSFTPAPSSTPEQTPIGGYPPGINASGLADIRVLAAAHQRSVGELSHTHWRESSVPERVSLPIIVTGYRNVTHHIAPNGTVAASGYSAQNKSEGPVNRFQLYDNGENAYSRFAVYSNRTAENPRDVRYLQVQPDGSQSVEREFRNLLTYYLLTTESRVSVVDSDPRVFRIIATGTPVALPSAVTNYTARAFVAPDGRVYLVAVTFDLEGTNESASLNFGVRAVSETTVSPPDWLDEARAATDQRNEMDTRLATEPRTETETATAEASTGAKTLLPDADSYNY